MFPPLFSYGVTYGMYVTMYCVASPSTLYYLSASTDTCPYVSPSLIRYVKLNMLPLIETQEINVEVV